MKKRGGIAHFSLTKAVVGEDWSISTISSWRASPRDFGDGLRYTLNVSTRTITSGTVHNSPLHSAESMPLDSHCSPASGLT